MDSNQVDTNRYCFSEKELKIIIKTKIDLDACDSILVLKEKVIKTQEDQKIELKNRIDALIEENKNEQRKKNRLKWGVGSVGVITGGLIIYAIIRK